MLPGRLELGFELGGVGAVSLHLLDRRLGPCALLLDGPRRLLLRLHELSLGLLRGFLERQSRRRLLLSPGVLRRRRDLRLDALLHLRVRRLQGLELLGHRLHLVRGGREVARSLSLGSLERIRELRGELFGEFSLSLRGGFLGGLLRLSELGVRLGFEPREPLGGGALSLGQRRGHLAPPFLLGGGGERIRLGRGFFRL